MRLLFISVALIIGQMNTLQGNSVAHLQPHSDAIQVEFGGKLLELINTPATLHLPKAPPKRDVDGKQWAIRIKDLGPNGVTVVDDGHFRVPINVGQTIQIYSNGTAYLLK